MNSTSCGFEVSMHVKSALLSFSLAVFSAPALAASASPYAGQEGREIAALSEGEIEGLLAGSGMGFARPAELNGYPGPSHVLELATQLRLSDAQLAQARDIHARMQAAAIAAGAELIESERELDALFRSGAATRQRLASALARVASAQARVREAHLSAHIEQASRLSQEQIARYNHLRGYAEPDGSASGHHHKAHP